MLVLAVLRQGVAAPQVALRGRDRLEAFVIDQEKSRGRVETVSDRRRRDGGRSLRLNGLRPLHAAGTFAPQRATLQYLQYDNCILEIIGVASSLPRRARRAVVSQGAGPSHAAEEIR